MKLSGVYTALVTPFGEDGAIDETALRKIVDAQIAGGVDGLVPMGTTGESPTVSHDENIRVIEIVANQAGGRVEIIAGTGSNSTAEAVRMTRLAAEVGATATLQVAPYYNKPTQEGLYLHFKTIAEATTLPVVVYNIPGRTGRNIEPETILRLAEVDSIVAVKEASGSMAQVMDLVAQRPNGFAVLSGDDNLTLPMLSLGANGVVSVASNIAPQMMGTMVRAALAGKFDEAQQMHYQLLPLFRMVFLQTNPIPIKAAMAQAGMLQEIYRLPLCELSAQDKTTVATILDQVQPR